MSVLGKGAIVTGAASEAGASMARMLLEGGAAYVGLLDRDGIRLEELADSLAAEFGESRVVALPTDLMDTTQVRHSVREFVRLCGRIDMVVENPGGVVDRTMRALVDRGISRQFVGPWRPSVEALWSGASDNVQLAVHEALNSIHSYIQPHPITVKSALALAGVVNAESQSTPQASAA